MTLNAPSTGATNVRPSTVTRPADRFFSPHRTTSTDRARTVVEEAIAAITEHEAKLGLRTRARKQSDQLRFEQLIEAVIADMTLAAVQGDKRGTAVSLSKRTLGKRSRYKPSWLSEILSHIIELLASGGYIRFAKG